MEIITINMVGNRLAKSHRQAHAERPHTCKRGPRREGGR